MFITDKRLFKLYTALQNKLTAAYNAEDIEYGTRERFTTQLDEAIVLSNKGQAWRTIKLIERNIVATV